MRVITEATGVWETQIAPLFKWVKLLDPREWFRGRIDWKIHPMKLRPFWLLSITGWLILGTWLVAPLLALGIAYLVNPWFRGYGAALLIVGLINGVARWFFLLTGLLSGCWGIWARPAIGARQFLLGLILHMFLFLMMFLFVYVLWFKFLFLASSRDPLWRLEPKEMVELDPFSVLTNMGNTLSMSVGSAISTRWILPLYLALKFLLIFLIVFFTVRLSYGKALACDKKRLLFYIGLTVWICSLIGFPPVSWRSSEERIVMFMYEVGWILVAGLIGRVQFDILTYSTGSQVDGEAKRRGDMASEP